MVNIVKVLQLTRQGNKNILMLNDFTKEFCFQSIIKTRNGLRQMEKCRKRLLVFLKIKWKEIKKGYFVSFTLRLLDNKKSKK